VPGHPRGAAIERAAIAEVFADLLVAHDLRGAALVLLAAIDLAAS